MSQRSNLRYQALPWLPRLVLMLLACGVVIGALGDEVFAQEVSDAQMRIFEDHVRRGGFFLHEKQFPEAIEELENARQIIDHPRVALTIAQAFEQWGQCVETRNHARALAMREDLGESARQTVVEMLATTRSCAQSGRLIVDCPEGATIEISGDDAASCPLDRELSAGAHTLRVHAQGYETRTERV
ncbi:MAG: PEGA domain-containing protein, partial [Bradymonadaceae bacterium]